MLPAYRRDLCPTQPSRWCGCNPSVPPRLRLPSGPPMRSRAVLIVHRHRRGAAGRVRGGLRGRSSSQSGKIAEGISIDGIDVGGMTGRRRRARPCAAGWSRSTRPSSCARAKRFTLPPQRAQVVGGRRRIPCGPPSRARGTCSRARGAASGAARSTRTSTVSISYSEVAIDRLVERVAGKIDEEAVDASVDTERRHHAAGLRGGRALKRAALRRSYPETAEIDGLRAGSAVLGRIRPRQIGFAGQIVKRAGVDQLLDPFTHVVPEAGRSDRRAGRSARPYETTSPATSRCRPRTRYAGEAHLGSMVARIAAALPCRLMASFNVFRTRSVTKTERSS